MNTLPRRFYASWSGGLASASDHGASWTNFDNGASFISLEESMDFSQISVDDTVSCSASESNSYRRSSRATRPKLSETDKQANKARLDNALTRRKTCLFGQGNLNGIDSSSICDYSVASEEPQRSKLEEKVAQRQQQSSAPHMLSLQASGSIMSLPGRQNSEQDLPARQSSLKRLTRRSTSVLSTMKRSQSQKRRSNSFDSRNADRFHHSLSALDFKLYTDTGSDEEQEDERRASSCHSRDNVKATRHSRRRKQRTSSSVNERDRSRNRNHRSRLSSKDKPSSSSNRDLSRSLRNQRSRSSSKDGPKERPKRLPSLKRSKSSTTQPSAERKIRSLPRRAKSTAEKHQISYLQFTKDGKTEKVDDGNKTENVYDQFNSSLTILDLWLNNEGEEEEKDEEEVCAQSTSALSRARRHKPITNRRNTSKSKDAGDLDLWLKKDEKEEKEVCAQSTSGLSRARRHKLTTNRETKVESSARHSNKRHTSKIKHDMGDSSEQYDSSKKTPNRTTREGNKLREHSETILSNHLASKPSCSKEDDSCSSATTLETCPLVRMKDFHARYQGLQVEADAIRDKGSISNLRGARKKTPKRNAANPKDDRYSNRWIVSKSSSHKKSPTAQAPSEKCGQPEDSRKDELDERLEDMQAWWKEIADLEKRVHPVLLVDRQAETNKLSPPSF